ncbi:MAG: hypothetical protein ISS47_08065 [Candidatus Omnitrophica bacterium]|nr:hypothetical protein [Candidatus Omnitrophota bacterium]
MTWQIFYTLNKSVISTGDNVILNLDIYNPDKKCYLYIGDISLRGPKNLNYVYNVKILVSPDTRQNLAVLEVPIPLKAKGEIEIKLYVDTYKVTYKDDSSEIDKFEDLGTLVRKGSIKFQVSPTPCYRAFVSRSIDAIDKPIVEPIVKMVQDWGFETSTVGINSFVEPHRDPGDKIIEDIIKSDCLVAIATIRDQSAFTGFFSTLEWLHTEVAWAYVANKPILLIVDSSINLEGVLRQKRWPVIPFSNNELKKLQYELDEILPQFRLAVEGRKTEQLKSFIQSIQQQAARGGYLAALEEKRINDSSATTTFFGR